MLKQEQIENFRRELSANSTGVSSYPHPWLMPDFWQYPTVSMGIGPIVSIYLARFNKYLHNRKIKDTSQTTVYAYLGDGETDEVESLGALGIATKEKLDNLIWVVNCNLQRLDGPVRGNGKIIQDLEGIFRGAGWNVIKVILGSEWDELLSQDLEGVLKAQLNETLDGEYQNLFIADGKGKRERFFNKNELLAKMVSEISDEELAKFKWGGHDEKKVFAAYQLAKQLKNDRPTVILAKTVKGFGMGASGEARNIAHQQKSMSLESLKQFVERFEIPFTEKELVEIPFYKPKQNSPEMKYLAKIRKKQGEFLPQRQAKAASDKIQIPADKIYQKALVGTKERSISTTMAFVQILTGLLNDQAFGSRVVPIVPDESRTFGMEALFRQYGIYSPVGQLYEPVDKQTLMPYAESKTGQILQEGINEAGAMSSFIAAGTSYSHQGIKMLPFYIYYSMFGFQRIGDLVWAACDSKARGFLLGATAGRTTLNGEGLQHEDGQSHILGSTFPNLKCYDPSFAYEIAVIIKDGIKRMVEKDEDVFYYLTVYNENYPQPAIPAHVKEEDIIKGIYRYQKNTKVQKHKAHILTSGITMLAALKSAEYLDKYQVSADIWAVPSFKNLREQAIACEREQMLNPNQKGTVSHIANTLGKEKGVFVACTEYMRSYPEMISQWVPGGLFTLGTDGFGRSAAREELRRFFEVDAESITIATLYQLYKKGEIKATIVEKAIKDLKYDKNKRNPLVEFNYF